MTQDNTKFTTFFTIDEQHSRLRIRYGYSNDSSIPSRWYTVDVSNIPTRAMQSIETICIHEVVLLICGRILN